MSLEIGTALTEIFPNGAQTRGLSPNDYNPSLALAAEIDVLSPKTGLSGAFGNAHADVHGGRLHTLEAPAPAHKPEGLSR